MALHQNCQKLLFKINNLCVGVNLHVDVNLSDKSLHQHGFGYLDPRSQTLPGKDHNTNLRLM